MSEEAPDDIAGLPVDDAVEAVVAGDADRDPDAVRAALDRVAEDGVVTRAAADGALADLSKVVATPETRVELAATALADAREAADPVADLDAVAARLAGFEDRLAALERRVEELGDDLQALVAAAGEGRLYEVGAGVRRVTEEANALQRAADDLQMDVESFREWVEDPGVRVRDLREDVEAVEEALDGMAAATENLAAAVEEGAGRPESAADPDVAWLDATLRHRVVGLLLADVRAELDDLHRWAEREDAGDGDRLADLAGRLDDLDGRHAAVGERLATLARPAWTERHGDRLSAFEDAVADVEPPVAWGEVRATLDRHRPAVETPG